MHMSKLDDPFDKCHNLPWKLFVTYLTYIFLCAANALLDITLENISGTYISSKIQQII